MKRRRAVLAWVVAVSSALPAGCNGLAGIDEPIEPLDAGTIVVGPDAGDDAEPVDDAAPADTAIGTVPLPAPCVTGCTPARASDVTGAYRVALDPSGANAYFTVQGAASAVYRIATDAADAGAATKVSDVAGTPYGIAVTSARVYWVVKNGATAAIDTRAIAADAATPLLELDPILSGGGGGIAAKDEIVYVDDEGAPSGSVWRIDGVTSTVYGPCSRAGAIAADHGAAFILDNGGTDVVWFAGAKENKSPAVLATVAGGVGVAVNDTTIFWTAGGPNGAVWALPKIGAPSPRLVAPSQSDASAIATDADGNVYFGAAGSLVTNAGGTTRSIASPAATPTSIAVSARWVFFVAGGTLWKIQKP